MRSSKIFCKLFVLKLVFWIDAKINVRVIEEKVMEKQLVQVLHIKLI